MGKVLIIEDMQEIREMLAVFLSKKGFTALSAALGEEGVSLTRQHKPDIVLIDIRLPDLNGIEVLKKIREFDKDIKIVMLSGLTTEDLEAEARQAGASGFLSKALGIEEISKVISDMIG
jgi:two-component system response regulator (stage 0 sporulation protein F)